MTRISGRAGLVPVIALAQRASLTELVAEQVRPGGPCGVNAQPKVPCLVAGMRGRRGRTPVVTVIVSNDDRPWSP
jgi:hypothetical protein